MAKKPTNHRTPWTPAQEKQLIKEAKQNAPTPILALHLKRTEPAIRAKAAELDLSLKPTNKPPYGTKK
jgi:hypothetical protein